MDILKENDWNKRNTDLQFEYEKMSEDEKQYLKTLESVTREVSLKALLACEDRCKSSVFANMDINPDADNESDVFIHYGFETNDGGCFEKKTNLKEMIEGMIEEYGPLDDASKEILCQHLDEIKGFINS